MKVAFLFNADYFDSNLNYADEVEAIVFKTRVLQSSNRHLKIGSGDVCTYGKAKTAGDLIDLCRRVYTSPSWMKLKEDQLESTYGKTTIFTMVVYNITKNIALNLNNILHTHDSYLGAIELDYTYGPHLALFRNSIGNRYRVEGNKCNVLYSMGDLENSDTEYQIEHVKSYGFPNAQPEDNGAHNTIFDEYDTLEHHRNVKIFESNIASLINGGEDKASELVFLLNDLNAKLFNSLAAGFRVLDEAASDEQVAQTSLSGRRYLEQLADTVFPPTDKKIAGRSLDKAAYKNRIGAFLSNNCKKTELQFLGTTLNKLVSELNSGIHGSRNKSDLLETFTKLAEFTYALLSLNPEQSRKPYFAYQTNMINFLKASITNNKPS